MGGIDGLTLFMGKVVADLERPRKAADVLPFLAPRPAGNQLHVSPIRSARTAHDDLSAKAAQAWKNACHAGPHCNSPVRRFWEQVAIQYEQRALLAAQIAEGRLA